MSYQSARLRHLLMLFLAFPAGVILSFALAFRFGEGFLILGFLWALVIELASRRIKCPVCQRPIGFGQYRIFSLRLEWWKAIPAKRCEYESHSAYKPNEEPNNSVWRFVVKLARVVFGATLVLAGALMMMVDRGEMIACGHACETVSTTLISISDGSRWALGSLSILVGVVTWVLPKLRRR